VKFSTRTRYGIRTMLEIGLHYETGGINQKDISVNQEIPFRTLDHLLQALKTAGLITNCPNKDLCYTLMRPPSQITMLDTQQSIEPAICVVDCISPHFSCNRNGFCSAKDFWCKLNEQIITYFKSVTLQEMISDQRKRARKPKSIQA
jgi:Rrf2 family protein